MNKIIITIATFGMAYAMACATVARDNGTSGTGGGGNTDNGGGAGGDTSIGVGGDTGSLPGIIFQCPLADPFKTPTYYDGETPGGFTSGWQGPAKACATYLDFHVVDSEQEIIQMCVEDCSKGVKAAASGSYTSDNCSAVLGPPEQTEVSCQVKP